MSSDVVKVSPHAIHRRISVDLSADMLNHHAWTTEIRTPLSEIEKHISIVQHFRDGIPWEDTPLFTNIYRRRFQTESQIRGCRTWEELVDQYRSRVEALYADMKQGGYRRMFDGRDITVYLTHDDEIVLGNQGNHRLAIAQLLDLDAIYVEVVARHPDSRLQFQAAEQIGPTLPDCAMAIPAMTTEAERLCYYRHTKEQASRGAVVELGAWLGAATAYVAAGMRDAGVKAKAHSYDRFVWKPSSHDAKAGGRIATTQLEAFKTNMGPLLAHVEPHAEELRNLRWKGGPVSLLICDAPKRIAEISTVLTAFTGSMPAGSILAWQDFAYFPSYDIPAAMIRLWKRVDFIEAIYPGTTAVFRVREPWKASEVSKDALALRSWTPDDVEHAWDTWSALLPEGMRPRFDCGAALFLCDIGATARAQARMKRLIAEHAEAILPKWRYLIDQRSTLMKRYTPLVELVQCA